MFEKKSEPMSDPDSMEGDDMSAKKNVLKGLLEWVKQMKHQHLLAKAGKPVPGQDSEHESSEPEEERVGEEEVLDKLMGLLGK